MTSGAKNVKFRFLSGGLEGVVEADDVTAGEIVVLRHRHEEGWQSLWYRRHGCDRGAVDRSRVVRARIGLYRCISRDHPAHPIALSRLLLLHVFPLDARSCRAPLLSSKLGWASVASPPWRPARSRPAALSRDRVRRPPTRLAGSRIPGPSWGRDAAIWPGPDRWGLPSWRSSPSMC